MIEPQYFTPRPDVTRYFQVDSGALQDLADYLTEHSVREVTVEDGALEWTGLEALPQRAESGAWISLPPADDNLPVIAQFDPTTDAGLQEAPAGARYAFETP